MVCPIHVFRPGAAAEPGAGQLRRRPPELLRGRDHQNHRRHGDFDIVFGHLSRTSQLCATRRAPCDWPCLASMLIGAVLIGAWNPVLIFGL